MPKRKIQTTIRSFRLSPPLDAQLRQLARESYCTDSELVRKLIIAGIGARSKAMRGVWDVLDRLSQERAVRTAPEQPGQQGLP